MLPSFGLIDLEDQVLCEIVLAKSTSNQLRRQLNPLAQEEYKQFAKELGIHPAWMLLMASE